MASTAPRRGFRFSLRGLLAVIVFFAVACAALKFANNIWWMVISSVAILLLMAMATVALLDRGPRRAFSIGFVTCTLIYAMLIYASGEREFAAIDATGCLATTNQLAALWNLVAEEQDVKSAAPATFSGNVAGAVVTYNPADGLLYHRNGTTGYRASRPPSAAAYQPAYFFMHIGHVLWAMMLGFIGGQFARFVYARRQRAGEGNN